MRLTDEIASYILEMLERADDDGAELKRNELAEELGCVPSQINYVLMSRFTPERGYVVESRRGGGGYIRVRRVKLVRGTSPLMHTVNSVGDELTAASAAAIADNLMQQQVISPEVGQVMKAALSDRTCRDVPPELRGRLRACLLKRMLTALIS